MNKNLNFNEKKENFSKKRVELLQIKQKAQNSALQKSILKNSNKQILDKSVVGATHAKSPTLTVIPTIPYQNQFSFSTSLIINTSGNVSPATDSNTFLGANCGNNSIAVGNTQVGSSCGSNNTVAQYCTMVGYNCGQTNTNGFGITLIGQGSDVGFDDLTNATAIGQGAIVTESNMIQLGRRNSDNVSVGNDLTVPGTSYFNNGIRVTTTGGFYDDMFVTGLLTAVSGIDSGPSFFSDTVDITGVTTMHNDLNVSGFVNGGNIHADGGLNIDGNAHIIGTTTMDDSVACNNGLILSGQINIGFSNTGYSSINDTNGHLVRIGSSPIVTVLSGSGTGGVASLIRGSDNACVVSLTMGTGNLPNNPVFSITFGKEFDSQPVVIMTPVNSSSVLPPTQSLFVNDAFVTTTGFQVFSGSSALPSSSGPYLYAFHIMG